MTTTTGCPRSRQWPDSERDGCARPVPGGDYLDVIMAETLRRHALRPQASEFGPDDMRSWYRSRYLLASIREHDIQQTSTIE